MTSSNMLKESVEAFPCSFDTYAYKDNFITNMLPTPIQNILHQH